MDVSMILTLFFCSVLHLVCGQDIAAMLRQLGLGGMGGMGGMGGQQNIMGGGPGAGVPGSGACPYQADANQFKYTQVVNKRRIVRDCAPGTMFAAAKCTCINIPSSASGGSGGGLRRPLPGSNPRLQATLPRAGPMHPQSRISDLLQKLQAVGAGAPKPPAPRRAKPRSGSNNDAMSMLRSLMSKGRNQQSAAGGKAKGLNVINTPLKPVISPVKYKPKPAVPTIAKGQPTKARGRVSLPGASAGLPPDILNLLQNIPNSPHLMPKGAASKKRKPKQPKQPKRLTIPVIPAMRKRKKQLKTQRKQIPSVAKRTRPGGPKPDPLADLLAKLSGAGGGSPKPPFAPPRGRRPDPLNALLAGLTSGPRPRRPPPRSRPTRGPSPDIASILASIGAAPGPKRPVGPPPGMGSLNALLGSLGNTGPALPGAPGGMLDVTSLAGNARVAALMGETPGPALAANLDLTSYFNAQGEIGGIASYARAGGTSNINLMKLQDLDRRGILDLGDLSPSGLMAANAHFARSG